MLDQATLLERDRSHLVHPLHHPSATENPLMIESGTGIWLNLMGGRKLIDGLSGLWNVEIGHGNAELAAVAQQQMNQIAYCSNYAGTSNLPAIELADKLAGLAYSNLNATFFTSGGAESNESAFKTVRYYWKRKGKPNKVKVIAREHAYHGVTMAAMSATGLSPYWPMFEPRVPNFLHVPAPYPFRFDESLLKSGETVGQAAARLVEEAIIHEGADTVAAVIAEPVQGAGGVIVPPADYFPHLRRICDEHEVLLISDEVITGFGRTGEWFALNRWGVQPDIMSFAKGVTSGYLPLGGIQISDEIRETIMTADPANRWMHAYTYSGHPTCCAVALKNLEIIERESLVDRAAERGIQLLTGLQALADHPNVGDVRGLGLMCAVEFVADKTTKAPANIGAALQKACMDRGMLTRNVGDILVFAPPLIISREEVDQILDIVRDAIEAVIE
jgi:adenosylmethionine-8-amino-7-oxononanoate aminotransferase